MDENKRIKEETPISLADAPTKKKISFFAAIILVIGNSVGAGIFFKSSTVMANSGFSLPIAILAWLVAGFAVICMSLALVEVSSGRNDNLGVIGWCKAFNGKYVYKACKYFMVFIYLPLTYFFMPLYVLMSFQDALGRFGVSNNFGTSDDWAIWSVISLLLSLWFIFAAGLSSRIGDIQNKFITALKFLPLIFAAIMGWIIAGIDGFKVQANVSENWGNPQNADYDFFQISPLFGFFGSLAAIFFAYDGFYATAGVQTEMREPKKTPKALVIGLSIVTSVYILIAVSMSVVDKTADLSSFSDFLGRKGVSWIGGIVNLLVAVGVMGILNGFSMWCTRYIQDLINEGELPIPAKWFRKCDNSSFPIVGVVFTVVLTVPIVIVFDIIGGLGYFPGKYAGGYDLGDFNSTAKLYNFADLLATWCAVYAFAFIAWAIYGCIRNRKTNHVKVEKNKYFIPTAWVSVAFVFAALFMSVVQPFVNIGLTASIGGDKLIGNILLVVVLFLFAGISFVPVYFEERFVTARLAKLETWLEKYSKKLETITQSTGINTQEKTMCEEYIESLRGYIKATKIGIESFKIDLRKPYCCVN